MDAEYLINLIDTALSETDNVVADSLHFKDDEEPVAGTKKVLLLLRSEIQHNPEAIHNRVLRAMHDLGMSAYKDFENTPLEDAIGNVTEFLYQEIPRYKELEPLRMDFGKGDPV
ncbi:MAG: hypothetical protein V1775_08300 [Bacteroidota bacterium]